MTTVLPTAAHFRDEPPQTPARMRPLSPEQLQAYPYSPRERLTDREYHLAREYVLRQPGLSSEVSERIGTRLAEIVEARTGIPRADARPHHYLNTILALHNR